MVFIPQVFIPDRIIFTVYLYFMVRISENMMTSDRNINLLLINIVGEIQIRHAGGMGEETG